MSPASSATTNTVGASTAPPAVNKDLSVSEPYTGFYAYAPSFTGGVWSAAGDVDGDGKDELAVGALLGSAPGRNASGLGYVFWSGAFGRGTAFRRALAIMPKLGVRKLVTARFPLEKIEDAFAHAAAGHGIKTVLVPNGG